MLQQLQRKNMEESQPINSCYSKQGEISSQARANKERSYECLKETQNIKPIGFFDHLKRNYMNYFIILVVFLMLLIIIELCFNSYLTLKRESIFKRNMKLLREYKLWDQKEQYFQNNQKQTINRMVRISNKHEQTRPPSQLHLNRQHIETAELKTQLNDQIKIKQSSRSAFNYFTQDQSQQAPIYNQFTAPSTTYYPSLNTQFDFQSSTFSSQLVSNANQAVTNIEKPSNVQPQVHTIPTLQVVNNVNNDQYWIDYSNYTGITVDQVTRSLIWMQLKNLPLVGTTHEIDSQRDYYEKKYGVGKYGELPICVVVPSFNNAENNRHINNMNSVLMQEYSNYHLIFIDDASTDTTYEDVKVLLERQQKLQPTQYTIIRNDYQKKAMHNLRMAATSYCQPQDIFIVVDGDDELIGRQVFKLYNAIFQQSGAWFAYSNFLTADNYVGFSRMIPPSIIANNNARQYPFVTSHLRAFYTQLFRNIKEADLRDSKGQYLQAANDVAICMPILEQAQQRVFYVPQLTYFYNSDTGLNNHFLRLKQQKKNELKIRSMQPYTRLDKLFN